jgi:predicted aspartyl protease
MRSPSRTATIAFIIATVLLAVTSAGATATSLDPPVAIDAPPDGLHPSTAKLETVLAAWRAADGSATKKIVTEVENDDVSAYGLTGVTHIVVAGDDYRETDALGPVTTQFGRYHGQRWRLNENSILINEIGVHKRNQVDSEALHAASIAPTKDVTLAGEVDAPAPAYVLRVNPPDGRLQWLLVDKKSSLLDSEIDVYPERRLVISYDDYRPLDGEMRAWHTHVADGRPQNDEDYRITSDDFNVPVPDDDIAIPQGGSTIVSFPDGVSSVKLPATVTYGSVVVRLTINGRGLDFLLDSGADGIVLDSEVAKEIGVKTFGKFVQTTMGSYEASQAVIPEIGIGTVTLRNTYVQILPFNQQLDYGTKIVGLLGFDFIANAVVTIDYDHGTVTATNPDQFKPPTTGVEIGAVLDDGVPYVQAQVDNAVGEHFILDTGADDVVIFSSFADAHPDDVADEGLGRSINAAFPFLSAVGVGGEIAMTTTQVSAYHFGTVKFEDFLLYRTHGNTAFEGEDEDGLVGYDVLRYFLVTLDYRDGEIYLQPGQMLQQASPSPPPHRMTP